MLGGLGHSSASSILLRRIPEESFSSMSSSKRMVVIGCCLELVLMQLHDFVDAAQSVVCTGFSALIAPVLEGFCCSFTLSEIKAELISLPPLFQLFAR